MARSLGAYLVLPRPGDAIKWWIFPLGFGLGVALHRGVDSQVLVRAAVAWALLELLIYQARYQWNDIRGFAADQRHPDAAKRGRLPGPIEHGPRNIAASWAMIALRLGLAATVAVSVGSLQLATPVFVLALAVFSIAGAYEVVRSLATGRDGAGIPEMTPAIVGVWLVVGGGYAVRAVGGLAFALELGDRPGLLAACIIASWAFGVAFVTGRWSLESLAFARLEGARVRWSASADQAREHTLALARWLPEEVASAQGGLDRWQPLLRRTSLGAPWNLALVVSGASAAVAGRLLVGREVGLGLGVAAMLGGVLAAVVALAGARRPLLVALSAAALAASFNALGSPRAVLAAVPWVAVGAAHAWFSAQSLATLGHPLRVMRARRDRRTGAVDAVRAVT
ncbi:MAG: putative rane protein [Thermoleophilia bacterium]|nr:putative rane protein [Thermoleophilia bacterium]